MHVPILVISSETTRDSIQPGGRALIDLSPKRALLAKTHLVENLLLFEKVEHSAARYRSVLPVVSGQGNAAFL